MNQLPEKLKRTLKQLPDLPGVYLMKDKVGEIIYVGKAASIKKRVPSYFQKTEIDPKTRVLVKNIRDVEYIITNSEIEALLLENSLIKKHLPKFNVRLRDDKRFPYIAITRSEKYPRAIITRKLLNNGNIYFGPYTDAGAARKTVATINSAFKLKTCKKEIPLKKNERSCLNYQMNRCQGICRGIINREEYNRIIDSAIDFLEGNFEPLLGNLHTLMQDYSGNMEFEKAAKIRDMIHALERINHEQQVVTPIGSDQDTLGISVSHGRAVLVLFEFRSGVLLGRKVFNYDNADYTGEGGIIQTFLIEYYTKNEAPAKITIEREIANHTAVEEHLTKISGKAVQISLPRSQEDKKVLSMIRKNIDVILADIESEYLHQDMENGLLELEELLKLDHKPETIECYDISNIQGKYAVASKVTFNYGVPDKKMYRRFRIQAYDSPNDPGMIHEVLGRRLQKIVNDEETAPDLIVVDGGKPQLSRALEVRNALGLNTAIISLAKKFEEIYYSPGKAPLSLPASSPALGILKNIRDEAHRFAVGYHRTLRNSESTRSILDSIPHIGKKTRDLILKHLNDPLELKSMDAEELMEIPGVGSKTANLIYNYFHQKSYSSAEQ